ncbi:MAG: DUF6807 family protein [Pirellulales bacterium]
MLRRRILAALAVLLSTSAVLQAVEAKDSIAGDVDVVEQAGGYAITVNGKPVASYVYSDPQITRPYFAHVHAPDGTQVTRHHPPIAGQDTLDHPEFHPGIWLAFGDLSGNDYWRMKAKVRSEAIESGLTEHPGMVRLAGRNEYLDASDESKVVCTESFDDEFVVRPEGYLLLLDSTFTSPHEFYFGDQEEMGLGIRVATPMRVEKGDGSLPPGTGNITDAKGRKNGAEVGGNSADWCDYSGTVDGKHVGMTIFCHPDNFRPSWFHARDYGFMAANAFGRAAFKKGEPSKVVVKPGESLRLRYGILIHADEDGKSPNLNAAFKEYVELAGQ